MYDDRVRRSLAGRGLVGRGRLRAAGAEELLAGFLDEREQSHEFTFTRH
jgi:hypothetical protein